MAVALGTELEAVVVKEDKKRVEIVEAPGIPDGCNVEVVAREPRFLLTNIDRTAVRIKGEYCEEEYVRL